jgi:hypothetical protein
MNPKQHHEIAVRRIVRYLKGTRDICYILRPSSTPTLDCFADADFSGTWSQETAQHPTSVKSQTGYIKTFVDCPVLWTSKLQGEIALSMTEAEYISLLQAMRDLIPLQTILQELCKVYG